MAKLTKKRKRQTSSSIEPTPTEYEIKAIVGEQNGLYEVEWASSWVPKTDVNPAAVRAWTNRKLEISRARIGSTSPLSSIGDLPAGYEYTQDINSHPTQKSRSSNSQTGLATPEDIETSNEPAFVPRAQDAVISSTTEPQSSGPAIQDSYPESPVAQPRAVDFDCEPLIAVDTVEEDAFEVQFSPPLTPLVSTRKRYDMASLPAVPPHVMEEMATSRPGSPAVRSDGGRSPSVIPALYRSPIASLEDMNTSERYDTLFPPTEHYSAQLSPTKEERSPPYGQGEHILGLPLLGMQRDQYQTRTNKSTAIINGILNAPDDLIDENMLYQADCVWEGLNAIANHADLDIPEAATQYDIEPEKQIHWHKEASTKFRFLSHLLLAAGRTDLCIAIHAGKKELRNITNIFLQGIRPSLSDTAMSIYCIGIDDVPDKVDLLVILDSLDETPVLIQEPGLQVSLVAKYTIEHIVRSLPETDDMLARTKTLIMAVKEHTRRMTSSDENGKTVQAYAETLVQYMTTQQDVWPLPELSPLDIQAVDSSADVSNGTNGKRGRTISTGEPSAKRTKLEDINDTKTAQQRLLTSLTNAHSRYNALEQSFGIVQTSLEDTRTALHEVTRQKDDAESTVKNYKSRLDKTTSRVTELRARISELEGQLDEANNSLANHQNPERAEIEQYRLSAEKAEEKVKKMQKQLDGAKHDQEYARTEYQRASSTAATLANEVSDLKEALTKAEKAASGEQARLRALSNDTVTSGLLDENKQLQATIRALSKSLRNKEEEIARLRDNSRGRIGTRNSSVPRSPRMTSPMKMDSRSRHASPSAGEPRDRAKLHPLRNGHGL